MVDTLKILFLSAEVSPFAKAGGLGDVAGSLPKPPIPQPVRNRIKIIDCAESVFIFPGIYLVLLPKYRFMLNVQRSKRSSLMLT